MDLLLACFETPFHSKSNDDKSKRPLGYPCLWCSRDKNNPVRVSHSNPTGNLKAHQDGSTQDGRSTIGCPGRLTAKAQGHDIPLLVAERYARDEAERKKKSGPLDSFITKTKGSKFNNLTFNQGMCVWLVRQALPWSRLADSWLRACINYI
ncbi:uncharacterized protein MELLADRAFT_54657 [Melampsora larici-populina 98AG31]|uniref:Uncharacterized protein n=1 Tax=Melampsora larici-populina (strain 98AG31 / pathotype 3-4-7) TaxID=747676 RepID=F4R6W2_MELLP|nr:uncharacterized protein MELLADRAFT_54657 [Melampsora larici-populina 98AG31]EGG12386.1 hypothetical protein MELLADRAFT_54657 [Melampsora larici-populina 98AG31]